MPITLIAGRRHHIKVSNIRGTNETTPFRGFLLRLDGGIENIDTRDAFFGSFYENSQLADICLAQDPTVGGLTHINNDPVNVSSSNLILDEPVTNMTLEVTIVVRLCDVDSPQAAAPNDIVTACNPAESIYYYSAFKINVMAPAPSDSPATAATTSNAAATRCSTTILTLVASLLVTAVSIMYS